MKRRFFCDKLVFSLILLLLTSRIASAMSIVTAKKCPIYLVMEEKDGTISQAYLGTLAGSHQIKSIEGYVLTQQEMISTKVNKGSRCFLWRLSFAKPDNPAELMQVWIAYIQEKKIIEVASGKSRRNEGLGQSCNYHFLKGVPYLVSLMEMRRLCQTYSL